MRALPVRPSITATWIRAQSNSAASRLERHTLTVTEEAWPTSQHPSREPLPRVEDLPIADHGYDQQSVKAAFDSFYRHAAQLDASLRTLEAVDSFHRQAAALRGDLRVLRTAGWTQQTWPTTPAYGYGVRPAREGISPAVWRIGGEAAFIIVVAVALGVAKLAWWVIALVMAFTWLLVGLIEWASARDFEFVRTEPAPVHPIVEAEAPVDRTEEREAVGWTAFEEAQEPSDAMTMIGTPPGIEDERAPEPPAAEEAAAQELAGERTEPEPVAAASVDDGAREAEPGGEPRGHWWQRGERSDAGEDDAGIANAPRHVRVLPADEQAGDAVPLDPWERGFDEASVDSAVSGDEPDEETGEDERALAADVNQPERRRFRRR